MPSEEHEPPEPIPQAPACPPPSPRAAAIPLPGPTPWDQGRAGLGLSRLSGRVCTRRVVPGARQGPLPWLAPPEGGAAGPRARLSWRPRSPCKDWGVREPSRGTKPGLKGLPGFLSHRATKGFRGQRVRSGSGFSLMLLIVVSPRLMYASEKWGGTSLMRGDGGQEM